MIGFFLSHIFTSIFPFSSEKDVNVPRVDQPDKRDKKGIHEEHDCFFFNNPIVMFIKVMKPNIFHKQGH